MSAYEPVIPEKVKQKMEELDKKVTGEQEASTTIQKGFLEGDDYFEEEGVKLKNGKTTTIKIYALSHQECISILKKYSYKSSAGKEWWDKFQEDEQYEDFITDIVLASTRLDEKFLRRIRFGEVYRIGARALALIFGGFRPPE